MKITMKYGMLTLAALACASLSHAAEPTKPTQRADSCVILDARLAKAGQGNLAWEFELTHPGTYTVQLVVETEAAKSAHTGTVTINGTPLSRKLQKAYIIEDGLVSEFDQPAVLTETGKQTITVNSNIAVKKVRLVPQGYTKSRIYISSDKYYQPWLKMHQSAEKVAAMNWYKQSRFGMFIHWGVYSEAAGSWKGTPIEKGQGPKVAEWIMYAFKISREEYRAYARNFNPDKSFASIIAKLAKDTGMKYVVITAKHHDGFALFDSAYSTLDITDATDYQGDLVKELYDACQAEGVEFGVYYSHGKDWGEGGDSNYAKVKAHNDQFGVYTRPNGINLWDPSADAYTDYLENKAYAQVAELVGKLPKLKLIWFDGDGLITEAQAFRFYKMVYDLNPGIIINRRVGYDFGDYVDAGDNKTPAANELAAKHFETCGTANHSWGFKAHDHQWKSTNQLLRNFVDIVSKGGNYLLNIGPDGKGKVPEPCVKNLQEMGTWVKTNADAIFGTTRWTTFREGVIHTKTPKSLVTEFWFSARGDKVYAMSLAPAPPQIRILALNESAGKVTGLRLLGSDKSIQWKQTDESLEVDLTGVTTSSHGYVLEVILK
ncbi:MAG: alpha-L-fucosidase [Akkermansiaceae bacterium]|nr:alpha-L-fucosidase [Akkermansiaceae bacterium]